MSLVPSILQDGPTALEVAERIIRGRAEAGEYPDGVTAESVIAQLDTGLLEASDALDGVSWSEVYVREVSRAEAAAGVPGPQ